MSLSHKWDIKLEPANIYIMTTICYRRLSLLLHKKIMTKIYYLASCSTCTRIIKELNPGPEVLLQNIKTDKITEAQLEEMKALSGSYESLFSKRAMKYKALDLKNKNLTENDYKQYILDEYTFLKRPVIVKNNAIFVGNSKKTVEAAKLHF